MYIYTYIYIYIYIYIRDFIYNIMTYICRQVSQWGSIFVDKYLSWDRTPRSPQHSQNRSKSLCGHRLISLRSLGTGYGVLSVTRRAAFKHCHSMHG